MSKKRLLTLFLASLMTLSAVACSDNQPAPSDKTQTETPVDSAPVITETADATEGETQAEEVKETRPSHNVPEVKYGGADFNVLYPDWQGYSYYFFADEINGDAMNDAIYSRRIKVEDYLDVKLNHEGVLDVFLIATSVKNCVTAADDSYQLALTHCIYGVSELATSGYLYNYDELPCVDYNAEWWNREMMDVLRLGKNTYYGVSDFMIPCPYAIFFNKDMIKDFGLDNPYELVYNGEWTIDKFIELATAATRDTNGDGNFTTDDYRGVGLEEPSKWNSFMAGAGQYMTDRDENGRIQLAFNTEKMYTIVEKFADFAKQPGVIVKPDNSMSVADGKLLFELHTIAHAVEYRETEVDIGILPYPKFDAAQENYQSLDWGGLMAIPTSIKNPDMVGSVVELLAYESGNEVIPTYYDVLLDGKLARDEDSIAMIDILFDTITYEVCGNYFGFSAGITDYFFTIDRLAISQQSTDFASWYQSREKTADKLIKQFYKSLDAHE